MNCEKRATSCTRQLNQWNFPLMFRKIAEAPVAHSTSSLPFCLLSPFFEVRVRILAIADEILMLGQSLLPFPHVKLSIVMQFQFCFIFCSFLIHFSLFLFLLFSLFYHFSIRWIRTVESFHLCCSAYALEHKLKKKKIIFVYIYIYIAFCLLQLHTRWFTSDAEVVRSWEIFINPEKNNFL